MAFEVNGVDIKIDRYDFGATVVWEVYNESAEVPYDLTGFEAQFIVKKNKFDDDSEAVLNQVITLAEYATSIEYKITEELASNPSGTYYYGIRLYKNNLYVNTVVQGKLQICGNTFDSEV